MNLVKKTQRNFICQLCDEIIPKGSSAYAAESFSGHHYHIKCAENNEFIKQYIPGGVRVSET